MVTLQTPSNLAPDSRRALQAACAGNAVEWYDFAIVGALGIVLTPVFFPTDADSHLLLGAFAVYATAFLARPVGALFFGRRGDLRGRRGALSAVMLVMTAATAGIAFLPGYAQIGVLASVGLVLLRLTQGFAAGGEIGLAAVFISEHAPTTRRGAFASWHTATLALGVAAGLGVAALLVRLAPTNDGPDVWRFAFLLALPLGAFGLLIRRRASESLLYFGARRSGVLVDRPVALVWRCHRRAVLTGFALTASGSLAFNTFFVYLPNHLVATTSRTLPSALLAAVLGLLAAAAAALAFGRLSDRVGRRLVVLPCLVLLAVASVPLVLAATSASMAWLVLAEVVAGTAVGGILSVSMLAEMFPTDVRATGLAISVGLSTALLGGTAPLVAQVLFTVTGDETAPGIYVATVCLVALALVRLWPETAFAPLPDRTSTPA